MVELQENTIFETREELMVSPTGGNPSFRTAHFLKTTSASVEGPILRLPSLPLSSDFRWALKLVFNGWRDPLRKWKAWVDNMHSLHHSVWKDAGIYGAIMATTYRVRRNDDLVLGIAERWCSETYTFIFPWGEASITLEDMMILGGFSVLGGPVWLPLDSKELIEVEKELINEKNKVIGYTKMAKHFLWMEHFKESGSQFEHEAFLALWLSRFVFPGGVYNAIGNHVLSIAIHLARGVRIALAPTVLATLYRDLRLLRETISAAAKLGDSKLSGRYLSLTLWAPLQFVQVWALERLPFLQPKPNFIKFGQPRMARWHGLKKLDVENLRSDLDSAGDSFCWRPYAKAVDGWLLPKFYKEREEMVRIKSGPNKEELEMFARCLRSCELVGIDSIELYLPHRVSMQFGMDQDIPGLISPPSHGTPEIVWRNYCRPITDVNLYFPHRLFESDITSRYSEWWKQKVTALWNEGKCCGVRRKRTSRRSKRLIHIIKRLKTGNDSDVPPGFPSKIRSVEGHEESHMGKFFPLTNSNKELQTGNDAGVPPGFPPKIRRVEGKTIPFGYTEDLLYKHQEGERALNVHSLNTSASAFRNGTSRTIEWSVENPEFKNLQNGGEVVNPEPVLGHADESRVGKHKLAAADDDKTKPLDVQSLNTSPSALGNGTSGRKEWSLENQEFKDVQNGDEVVIQEPVLGHANESRAGNSNTSVIFDVPELQLEARVCKLEKMIAGLKNSRIWMQ